MKLFNGSVIKTVDLKNICVDPEYQRARNKNHVNRLGGDFDLRAVRMPIVNMRGGKMYCVDGQHTIANLLAKNYKKFLCVVFTGLTQKQEADLFYKLNAIPRAIQGWVNFRAAFVGGRFAENEIIRIIKSHRLTTQMDDGEVIDFKTPRVLVEQYSKGQEHFERLVRVMAHGWRQSARDRHLQPNANRTEMIRAVGSFLLANPKLSDSRIIDVLRRNPASDVLKIAMDNAGSCRKIRSIEKYIRETLEHLAGVSVLRVAG